jgi:hypothetical protein
MLSFMISCKKSNLLNNSFVFSLIALNAKTINFFDERDANERVDERTKERKNAYELRKKANVMMKKRTYEMMMMIEKKRDQANKKRNRRRNQKMNKKKRKRFNCVSFVIMRRFRDEMRFKWIDEDSNPADAMTKSKFCNVLIKFIDSNIIELKIIEWVERTTEHFWRDKLMRASSRASLMIKIIDDQNF